jgi:hypothetical protein
MGRFVRPLRGRGDYFCYFSNASHWRNIALFLRRCAAQEFDTAEAALRQKQANLAMRSIAKFANKTHCGAKRRRLL